MTKDHVFSTYYAAKFARDRMVKPSHWVIVPMGSWWQLQKV
jgi:hypothetical protein